MDCLASIPNMETKTDDYSNQMTQKSIYKITRIYFEAGKNQQK